MPQMEIFPRRYRLTAVMVLNVFVGLGAGCPTPRIPDQYVLAYTTGSPWRVETVASNGGRSWSAPNSPLDPQGNPLQASIVPPGIGANPDGYLLAWFDAGSVLHTVTSPDGGNWGNELTHGTFSVDGNSRPSAAFLYGPQKWFVAFRSSANAIVVLSVRPATGTPVTIAGVTTTFPPSVDFSNNRLLLAHRESAGTIGLLTSIDGSAWSAGPRTPLTSNNTPIVTETAPYLRSWPGGLWLATNRPNPANPADPHLSSWRIEVFASGDAAIWNPHTTVTPSFPFSEGPAVAGPDSALVIADPGAQQSAMSLNGREVARIATNTQRTVSLVHGPAGRVYNLTLHFIRRFQRLQPGDGTEDVTLNVEHRDYRGNVRARIQDWVARNRDKHASHFWSQGHPGGGTPVLSTVAQRGEKIVIFVSGDDGTVSSELSTDTFINAGSAETFQVRVDNRQSGGSVPYQVDFSFSTTRTP